MSILDMDRIWNAVREANGVPPQKVVQNDRIQELLECIAAPLECGCGPPICRCHDKERLLLELEERQDAAREVLKLMGYTS